MDPRDLHRPEHGRAVLLFAAGCFWSPEAEFRRMDGVMATAVGYAGGHVENPTYPQVCNKATGHAEAVLVVFDPSLVSYETLLAAFVDEHLPGPRPAGDQYRGAVFPLDAAQRDITARVLGGREDVYVEDVHRFWPAEASHQRYYETHGLSAPIEKPTAVPESLFAPESSAAYFRA